jgi:colanic acid/amylovoran biosynthesis glycosyltransferase
MMRFGMGVHGRFSAFNTAEGLIEIGHDVRIFTNYPPFIAARFGLPAGRVRGFISHGVFARAVNRIWGGRTPDRMEATVKRMFGAWLARNITEDDYDVAYCWSGVAEEVFERRRGLKVLNRSSVHIAVQRELLETEAQRVGRSIEMPQRWIIEREEREYALADLILVPSEAARRSFAGKSDEHKVRTVPLTATPQLWRPAPGVIAERLRRIKAGEPLRILYVGAVTYRKGMYDLLSVARSLHKRMSFRLTGTITEECRELAASLSRVAKVDGHVAETQLRESYAWADILVCPSIEDGFAVVLSHALASAVPFISTVNTGGPDLLAMGGRGWIVPIRAPNAVIAQLEQCDRDRDMLAAAVRDLTKRPVVRNWADVARDVTAAYDAEMKRDA